MKTATARDKLLNASLSVIRTKGYAATTVDDLCEAAGVTKGAFFHYFKTKEDLGVSAAQYWSQITGELFRNAPYHQPKDPLARVLGYIDFRKQLLSGKTPEFTCLVGTMVQEVFDSNPHIREACKESIFAHAAELEKDIALARKQYAPHAKWTAASLALHTQAVLQGAFILAKAGERVSYAVESVDHLRNYIELLFETDKEKT